MTLVIDSSTVVEHLAETPEIKGLNYGMALGRGNLLKNVI